MRLKAFLAFGLAAAVLTVSAASVRRAPLARAANIIAWTNPLTSLAGISSVPFLQVRKGSQSRGLSVREIDAEGLKKILQRNEKNPRPLLINFWATWCEPCREEFPDLVQIDKDYKARGLEFVTVSLDDPADIKTSVPQFLRSMRAPAPAYLLNVPDPEPSIKMVDATWGGALPATFLYDAQGQIVYKHMGRVVPAELREALEKVISDK
jgi:thiol-disulfide isomerase/thioredoxin